ncbi:MAG: hypothetical protein Q8P57_00175 [Candidatus Pacearchaeota archaeon]|nr:hypothetical protein [Candidatus Pacearchaeota archaeon]
MTEAPQSIDIHAGLRVTIGLLRFYPLVLVKEREKTKGIITKSDVIKSLR